MLYHLGKHSSISKGVHSTMKSTFDKSQEDKSLINAFQIFTKAPQRATKSKITDLEASKVKTWLKSNNVYLCAHSGYIFNLCSDIDTDDGKEHYGVEMVVDDMKTIDKMGGGGAVIHVGKHKTMAYEDGELLMLLFIVRILELTKDCKANLILETSTGQGTEMCVKVEQMGSFYKRFLKYCDDNNKKTLKKKLKFCIDTCHIFNAGYDISTTKGANDYIKLFDKHIGWNNVVLIHLNDSKNKCGAKLDRHENIGEGFITDKGKDTSGFATFIKHCAKTNKPMILETPNVKKGKLDEFILLHKLLA